MLKKSIRQLVAAEVPMKSGRSQKSNFSLTLLDSYQPRRAFLRGQVSIFNPNPLIFWQTLPTPTARPRK
jgi:hypothetical protein